MLRHAPRAVGVLTAAFGVLSVARPALLARSLGQTDAIGETPPSMVMLSQTIGARDLASGLAMALLPAGRARTTVMATHVAGDAVLGSILSGALVDPAVRRRIAVACYGWGAVVAAAGLAGASGRAAERLTARRAASDRRAAG